MSQMQALGPRVAVIALTARVMQEGREKCATAGMDDFLEKPLEFGMLSEVFDLWVAPRI